MTDDEPAWIAVGTMADVAKRRKVVIDVDERQILIVAHDGRFFAFDNICVHRDRELSKGVILNGKLVCPGHQWAFALDTGWEAIKQVCQPTHAVQVTGDIVEVRVTPAPIVASADDHSAPELADDHG
jgi:nitrite reductase (NADH) small subunit